MNTNLFPHIALNVIGLGVYDTADGQHKRTMYDPGGENGRKLVVLEPGDRIVCLETDPYSLQVSIERPQFCGEAAPSSRRLKFVCTIQESSWHDPPKVYLDSLLLHRNLPFLSGDRENILKSLFPQLEVEVGIPQALNDLPTKKLTMVVRNVVTPTVAAATASTETIEA